MLTTIIGNTFADERGTLSFNNELDLSEVKRMYFIENADLSTQRAWQGHQIEKRWFIAVKGKFLIKLVKVDNFECPSNNLEVLSFELQSKTLDALLVDAGYASSIQALEADSKLLVFSNYRIGEIEDNYKFNPTQWK
ncbi:sugar epimerase [Flavobacterium sp. LB3P21]|uniref:sugar epimerase n=1 Tax=unclassified Flavobacterium TaxID=196869 RepID=UPI003AAFDE69